MYDQKQGNWTPPQPAYGRPGYDAYSMLFPPPPPRNGLSTAALIFGFLPGVMIAATVVLRVNGFIIVDVVVGSLPVAVLGVIFGILGLVRAGKIGGTGRVRSVIGLTLSVLSIIGVCTLILVAENSPAAKNAVVPRADAGCVAVESKVPPMAAKVKAAKTASAKAAAIQPAIDELKADEAKTKRPAAKAAMEKFRKDLQQLQSGLRAHKIDPALEKKIETDGAAVDTACS